VVEDDDAWLLSGLEGLIEVQKIRIKREHPVRLSISISANRYLHKRCCMQELPRYLISLFIILHRHLLLAIHFIRADPVLFVRSVRLSISVQTSFSILPILLVLLV